LWVPCCGTNGAGSPPIEKPMELLSRAPAKNVLGQAGGDREKPNNVKFRM